MPRPDVVEHVEALEARNTSHRRKNAYQSNARTAKALWKSRATHEKLLSLAVAPATVDAKVKAAATAEYDQTDFKNIPTDDQAHWETIAGLVTAYEQTFEHLTPT
jgi:hypothetical protein